MFKKVFGIPDERLGEVVCAAIKITNESNLDDETVKNYCNGNVSICILSYGVDKLKFIKFYPEIDRKIQSSKIRLNYGRLSKNNYWKNSKNKTSRNHARSFKKHEKPPVIILIR
jgi:hypothetical protein